MLDHSDAKTLHAAKHITMVERDTWEFVVRNGITGIVVAVPVTDEGKLILVEQHRVPVRANVIEFPAGLVGDDGEPDESLESAAQRELLEETGYEASEWKLLMEGPPSPGLSDEVVTFFLATGLRKTGQGGGVDNEDIVVHEIGIDEFHDWLRAELDKGKMVDPKLYGGLYFVEKHLSGKAF